MHFIASLFLGAVAFVFHPSAPPLPPVPPTPVVHVASTTARTSLPPKKNVPIKKQVPTSHATPPVAETPIPIADPVPAVTAPVVPVPVQPVEQTQEERQALQEARTKAANKIFDLHELAFACATKDKEVDDALIIAQTQYADRVAAIETRGWDSNFQAGQKAIAAREYGDKVSILKTNRRTIDMECGAEQQAIENR